MLLTPPPPTIPQLYLVQMSSTVNCPTQGNQTITITLQQLFKGRLTSLIHLELFVHFKGETPQERINVDFEKTDWCVGSIWQGEWTWACFKLRWKSFWHRPDHIPSYKKSLWGMSPWPKKQGAWICSSYVQTSERKWQC